MASGSEDDESEVDDDLLWDDMTINGTDSPISGSFVPPAGAPFSALTPSIWPQDILARIQQVIAFILFVATIFTNQLLCWIFVFSLR